MPDGFLEGLNSDTRIRSSKPFGQVNTVCVSKLLKVGGPFFGWHMNQFEVIGWKMKNIVEPLDN